MISRIIIIGGHIQALGLARQAQHLGIEVVLFTTDNLSVARWSNAVSHKIVGTLDTFINKTISYRDGNTLILPTGDDALEFLNTHREVLSNGFILGIPDRNTVNIFSDKKNSNNLRLQTESSTHENINILLKKINQKNNAKQNNDNISSDNSNSKVSANKYIFSKKIDNARNKIVSINICRSNDITDNKYIYKKINNINKIIPITKGKNKIIPLHPYKKITIIKNKPKLKKINFNAILKNLNNNNNRYYSNFNKTQINNEETSQTSDKEIYRNISLKIKKEKLIKNNKKFSNELKINDSSKKGDDRMSIQSISDSKVLEIANTYIDDKVDKIEISGILTQKKLQNQNSYYDG